MAVELKVPTIGESITEVEIGEWLKKKGDFVKEDDLVVVIESEKASMEVPAPVSGVLTETLKQPGDTAEIGEVIGYLEPGEARGSDASEKGASDTSVPEGAPEKSQEKAADKAPESAEEQGEPRVMPAARRALAEKGLSASEVEASGPGGRLLKEDVEAHGEAASKPAASKPAASPAATSPPASSPGSEIQPSAGARQEDVVRMTSIRRRIAERLVGAQQQAALLTTFNEVDMSAVMSLRKEYKEAFIKRHDVKLGFMSFFVKAVIEGLKEIPALNAEIRDQSIVYRNYYDIGVAVGGGRGLVVPVMRNAERLSFAGVEKTLGDLATRARDNTLTPEELQGGTFTISNGGIYGSMLSTPIVNPPQSGILGMHNIVDRPVAVNGQVEIRPIMYVALTYDHRIVDGREAVTFLVRVKECIEQPARMLLET